MSMYHVYSPRGGPKRALNTRQELQTVRNHWLVLGTEPGSLQEQKVLSTISSGMHLLWIYENITVLSPFSKSF